MVNNDLYFKPKFTTDKSSIKPKFSTDKSTFKPRFNGQGPGITSYNDLFDKPSINNVELIGNKTGFELGLQDMMAALSESEIDKIIYGE